MARGMSGPGKHSMSEQQIHFENVPIKPPRVYKERTKGVGSDTCIWSVLTDLSQIAGAQFSGFTVRALVTAGPSRLRWGWERYLRAGVRARDPDREIVALSG